MQSFGFVGSVPPTLIEAAIRITRPETWRAVYVVCSGAFRAERALARVFPGLTLHSNDVSLFSTALAKAALGEPFAFRFTGELAFIEDLGLTDDILGNLAKIDVSSLGAGRVTYQELQLSFLPEDLDAFRDEVEKLAERIGKRPKHPETWIARLADFDHLFETLVRVKHKLAVVNTALAMLVMAELANERLDQLSQEEAGHAPPATSP